VFVVPAQKKIDMTDQEVRKRILDGYLSQVEDLPTIPYVVVQIMERIQQPVPEIEELADLIMTDQVLTTQLLRMVNSAFYGLNRTVVSVKETVIYLGLREIENLIYSVTLTNTFEIDAPLLKRIRFWEHSFGCALYSRLIAKKLGYPGKEQAYLAGLLHDIGEVIIALHLYQEFEKVVTLVKDQGKTFFQAEEEVLGINHTDLGSWLVDRWKLPSALSSVITYHHTLEKAGDDTLLVAIVRLADLICLYHKLDFGYPEGESLTAEIVAVWRLLITKFPRLAKEDMQKFLDECNEQIAAVKNAVQMVYKDN
jgi:HD-like signal output (HDOD) protein